MRFRVYNDIIVNDIEFNDASKASADFWHQFKIEIIQKSDLDYVKLCINWFFMFVHIS